MCSSPFFRPFLCIAIDSLGAAAYALPSISPFARCEYCAIGFAFFQETQPVQAQKIVTIRSLKTHHNRYSAAEK